MSKDVEKVGDWLYNTLSSVELKKIIVHEMRVFEPASKVILSVEISLFELRALRLGEVPKARNYFGMEV